MDFAFLDSDGLIGFVQPTGIPLRLVNLSPSRPPDVVGTGRNRQIKLG